MNCALFFSSQIRLAAQRVQGMSLLTVLAALSGCGWMSSGQNSEGVRLFQQGNYDAAAQRFRQAMQTEPQNPDSYYNLAAFYHRQGKLQQRGVDLAQAESYYRQCLDHNPNHVECRRGLAVLLVEQGRSDEAFKMMEDWDTQNPTLAAPKIELARMFEEFGDKDAAKQHLTAALAIAPDDSRRWRHWASCARNRATRVKQWLTISVRSPSIDFSPN